MAAARLGHWGKRFWISALAVVCLAALGGDDGRAQARESLSQYVFTVEIEGMTLGRFREVSGLGVETEIIEYRDGSTNEVRKLPGRTVWPEITLKRGFTGNRALYDWATTYLRTGNVVRRSGSITMYDQTGAPVAQWNFRNGWPAKWKGPDFDTSGNEVAVETLVIAHEGLELAGDDR